MLFDIKYLAILAFIIINFLTLFAVKSRSTLVISLIITNLVAVVFFSTSIANYIAFKEITLSLIAYSMIVLFLVSSNEKIYSEDDRPSRKKTSYRSLIFNGLVFLTLGLTFFSFLAVTQNIGKISETLRDQKLEKQQDVAKEMAPDVAENEGADRFGARKRARLKDQLSDNFLFKRHSDVILIIVAVSTILLIVSSSNSKKNESV